MIKGEHGVLRPLMASEREVLMGFPRGYTSALLKKMPEEDEEIIKSEDLLCAAIGNSFHTNTVAAIFDKAFAGLGMKKEKGPEKIVRSFVESLSIPPEPPAGVKEPLSEDESAEQKGEDDTLSLAGEALLSDLEVKGQKFPTEDDL